MKNKKGFAPIVLIIGVVVVLAAVGGVSYFSKKPQNNQQPTTDNQQQATINNKNSFEKKELFKIEWGKDSGQVGYAKVAGLDHGPSGFYVDEQNNKVYILDSVNNRVESFDLNGNFLNAFSVADPIINISSYAGNLYVLSHNEINEYKTDGSLIKTYNFNQENGSSKKDIIKILPNEVVKYFTFMQNNGLNVLRGEYNIKDLTYKYEDIKFWENSSLMPIIDVINQNGNIENKIIINPIEGKLEGVVFVGTDKENNLYIITEETMKDGKIESFLQKYTIEGKFLYSIKTPFSGYADTDNHGIEVSESGNVYQLLPMEDSVRILRY